MSPARVVVTGGCGFIGSHLVRRLADRGDRVCVVDRAPPPVPGPADYRVADVRDPAALAGAIHAGVEVIYHLAAEVGVDRYLARPLDVIDITFTGTRNVLELARRAGARVVLASTSEVFGKNPAVPWREDGDRVLGATSADRWTYAAAKGLAEHLGFGFARQHGLAVTILRYFNVYGPGQRPAYLVSRCVHRALNRRPMVLYDQGRQTRAFTFVDDAVEATLRAAASPAAVGEAFNLGSTTETPVAEVVERIAGLTGSTAGIRTVDTGSALGPGYEDLPRRIPDTSKARALLGWECRTGLPDGLAETVGWARRNPWWLAQPDHGAG